MGRVPKLNNYRYLMVVNNLWFLLQEMGLGWTSPYILRLAAAALYKGKNTYTILRFKQGFDRRLSTIGKSLRFTIPHSKANNKSKSVWWSIHPAPKSLPCIQFSESRILTLGHSHKHCRISLVDERSSDIFMDSASQTNIYRSFTTLRFCVTPIKSSVIKRRIFLQGFSFSKNVLASWQVLGPVGYGPSHHLQTLNSSSGQRIFNPTSNFQLPSILKIHPIVLSPFLLFVQD